MLAYFPEIFLVRLDLSFILMLLGFFCGFFFGHMERYNSADPFKTVGLT